MSFSNSFFPGLSSSTGPSLMPPPPPPTQSVSDEKYRRLKRKYNDIEARWREATADVARVMEHNTRLKDERNKLMDRIIELEEERGGISTAFPANPNPPNPYRLSPATSFKPLKRPRTAEHSNMEVDSPRSPSPPTLPLQLPNGITIFKLGRIREGWSDGQYIFPEGYEITRPFFSTINPEVEVMYTCRIIANTPDTPEARPTFEIIPTDQPDLVFSSTDPDVPWAQIIASINEKILSKEKDRSSKERALRLASVNGLDMIGLNMPEVRFLIQQSSVKREGDNRQLAPHYDVKNREAYLSPPEFSYSTRGDYPQRPAYIPPQYPPQAQYPHPSHWRNQPPPPPDVGPQYYPPDQRYQYRLSSRRDRYSREPHRPPMREGYSPSRGYYPIPTEPDFGERYPRGGHPPRGEPYFDPQYYQEQYYGEGNPRGREYSEVRGEPYDKTPPVMVFQRGTPSGEYGQREESSQHGHQSQFPSPHKGHPPQGHPPQVYRSSR